MTTLSQIITDAYRESDLIPLVASPNSNQLTEGLNRLNNIILSTVGNEVGNNLQEFNIDGPYTETSLLTTYIPDNARLMLNLASAITFNLDPFPKEGQRVAVVDVAGNLATYNLTLDGNGRNIEGGATLVLNTNDTVAQWMYRSDAGWVIIEALTTADEMPFPREYDDYFITMLALRLNPRYGQMMANETMEALKRSRRQICARYNHSVEVVSDVNPRGMLAEEYVGYDYDTDFNTGRTFSWR